MTSANDDWKPIKLSAKVFGHISQGLYRTPAGAIKELISNAFDADSPYVKIHTDFPRFETFSCEDAGVGISAPEFQAMMDRGFGSSEKRNEPNAKSKIYERPLIGRLGIGILSLAQICTEFRIVSHHAASKTAFEVDIRFPPYTREELDRAEKKSGFVVGGSFRFVTVPFDRDRRGVRIFTESLRDTFRKRMRDLSETRFARKALLKKDGPYTDFAEYMKCIYETPVVSKSLTLASDYDQLIFGLAMASPVPYFDQNVVLDTDFVGKIQRRLESFKFSVEVDNLKLRKPLMLPSTRENIASGECSIGRATHLDFELTDGPHRETSSVTKHAVNVADREEQFAVYELKYHNPMVGGRPLKISGYMFNQTGRLYPREIQGVMVRIRNVAIGGYDNSLMFYPWGEGPRFSMVNMEIFIEEGFEDALNIDRDSFNGLDPHYVRVQSYIHGLLRVVFPEIWTEEKERNRRSRERKKSEAKRKFVAAVSRTAKLGRVRKLSVLSAAEVAPEQPPVTFRKGGGEVEISARHPLLQPVMRRRKNRPLAEQISVAFERALMETTDEKRREVFYGLLAEILSI